VLPPLAAPTALSFASHNGTSLVARPGFTMSVAWADTGNGFSCSIINETGADLGMTLAGFTAGGFPTHPDNFAKIKANAVGAIWVYTPDAGVTKVCRLLGYAVA
jgi:hypothetical protein